LALHLAPASGTPLGESVQYQLGTARCYSYLRMVGWNPAIASTNLPATAILAALIDLLAAAARLTTGPKPDNSVPPD
jgi:hypothetical protein